MVVTGVVSATAATTITNVMLTSTDKGPQDIANEHNLIQKSDAGELETIVDQVLVENVKAVDDVKSGGKKSKKARGFLLGQVMQKTKGQANPKVVSQILAKKLG
jgi:aspartyl-tRNA(Asn)/glutamyl-tRNA(Gln) amidotransferase subunit B